MIGGGINGLAALEALTRLGKSCVLVEQFELGTERGSSHGAARIARSTYHDPQFARMMRVALAEDWPRLERDAEARLLHRTPGCIFGPEDGEIAVYEKACAEAGAAVRRIEPSEARQLFPSFALDQPDENGTPLAILSDETAAVVAARETMDSLAKLAVSRGAELREHTRVLSWQDDAPSPITVETDRGRFTCERLVVCAGPWSARLLPHLSTQLTVLRQQVGYYSVDAPKEEIEPGRFPIWVRLGRGPNELLYGLPQFQSDGIKIARHCTSAANGEDPDEPAGRPVAAADVRDLEDFLRRYLRVPLKRFEAGEHCLYTMTESEEFVLGPHPKSPRVIIGAGFSGHSFKFAPTIGRTLAEFTKN